MHSLAISECYWAHPRSRGEHEENPPHPQNRPGSSPLARGTLVDVVKKPVKWGLIPARAGNTRAARVFIASRRAHPRSRGEHISPRTNMRSRRGSSPLARGTPSLDLTDDMGKGLIPARAGNTTRQPYRNCRPGAHPRSRGEHPGAGRPETRMLGSSPLARGTRRRRLHLIPCGGLIPARAGNTQA